MTENELDTELEHIIDSNTIFHVLCALERVCDEKATCLRATAGHTTTCEDDMRTKEQTVYTFDELSESAKDRARDWFRQFASDDFNESSASGVIEDCARHAALFGLDIRQRPVKLMNGSTRMDPEVYYSGFCSQGDGASYSGSYSYHKGSVKAVESDAPSGEGKGYVGNNELNRIVRELHAIQRRHFYQINAVVRAGRSRYSHSATMEIDVERADERPMADEDQEAVSECLKDFADYIYRQLEREYEYRQSDEVVDEDISANGYEFDEHGKRE